MPTRSAASNESHAHLDGTMDKALQRRAEQKLASSLHGMRGEEAAVLALLQERLKREAAANRKTAA
jgi:DNA topoisomerase-1